jgi:TBC1 domain family protein 5
VYPLLDEKPPAERYTWDHRSGLESASELAELRQQNKHLGEAVAWILEILNQGEDNQGHQEAYEDQRKQSLESLSYVRDVLSGQVAEVDERRLWGEEEFKRRWEIREKSQSVAHEAAVSGREGRASEVTRSSSGASSPSLPLDNRRFSPNTSVSSSVNGPLRSFMSSSSGHTTRATSLTTTHNRSQSSGTLFSSRPTLPQRAPVRTSANNPFQRVSNQENAATTGQGDQSPKARSEVQHDPLGALK